jgi:hypothetical protein
MLVQPENQNIMRSWKGGFPLCEYRLPEIKSISRENNDREHKLPPDFINLLRSVVGSIEAIKTEEREF